MRMGSQLEYKQTPKNELMINVFLLTVDHIHVNRMAITTLQIVDVDHLSTTWISSQSPC